jgi:Haem-binding uptake, Tiki superfamily, ChaN
VVLGRIHFQLEGSISENSLGNIMKCLHFIFFFVLGAAQAQANHQAKPQDATVALIQAFDSHDVVMLGEWHADKQEHEWLRKLVSTPEFADRVDDIVMEFGNALYQKSVDRYVSGDDIPLEQVQKAWRNTVGGLGPPSPVYALLYQAVRESNLKRRGKHQMRILCGDPYIDWDKVKDMEDVGPYLGNRDQWYAQVVKSEVLAKKHHALLIAGGSHFLRWDGPGYIERELRAAGARTFLVAFGTNAVGNYDDLDKRFDSWPRPAIVSLADNWVGDLPAMPVLFGGTEAATALKLVQVADALLYVAPRDLLRHVFMSRSELDGTAYGKEIARRTTIEFGQPLKLHDEAEVPEFERPQPQPNSEGPPELPSMPKSINAPLPPRPPSQ